MADKSAAQAGNASVVQIINNLLGIYWGAYAQHRMHVALIDSWGIEGLARSMEARTVDEPGTITALSNRLLDLDGEPDFAIIAPNIGKNLREVLENDLKLQSQARPALNAAAEAASSAHDAVSRAIFEGILTDEEEHLSWLGTEIRLLDLLGEPLYVANRLHASQPNNVAQAG